ncbi:sensor histidine kinase [Dyadobacter sediminis]|nr:histidine kinase [Dyadobacter sediminis]
MKDPLVERLLFPPTQGLRAFYHICFWVLFILLHYAYALPTLAQKAADPSVTLAGFAYFAKTIPEYYICIGIYNVLRKYIHGFFLFFILLLSVILLNHLVSILLFLWVDYAFGLEKMPERFRMFAQMYLSPFNFQDINSWLVFTVDLSEAQFFILPVALKIVKYAAEENIIRQKVQNAALSMELKVLKSQINPHFVFNVLNAAYAKILPISEDAAEYLEKASEILRFSLYETTDEFIQLDKEISYLNRYVELETIRSQKRCKASIQQHGEICEQHSIPTLLLITLVENAFKHGVHATRHNSYVDIRIYILPDSLEFIIVNSKPQQPVMRSKKNDRSGGIGLVNLAKRMEIYYPGNHKFEKIDADGEFRVTLKLPL